MISRYERLYTAEGARQGLRADGRACDAWRPVSCAAGVFEQCSGSARVQLGDTQVIATVKAELGAPAAQTPNLGRLSFAVEHSSCAVATSQGRRGEEQAAELARALEQSIQPRQSGKGQHSRTSSCVWPSNGGVLDLAALCVLPGRSCWILNIDGLVLNADGSVLDALSLAVRAALADTSIPLATIVAADDPLEQPEVDIDPDPSKYLRLDVARVPVTLSIGLIGGTPVLDMTAHEELCVDSLLQVSINLRGALCGVTQRGAAGVPPATLQAMLGLGQTAGPKLARALHAQMNME